MAAPVAEAKVHKPRLPALETEELSNADQPSAREDQKSNSNIDTPFDAHTVGWEVVDGEVKTVYESSHFTSDHSDLTEDKSKTQKRSNRRKEKHIHETKGKNPTQISVPHVHPDDFEDPISDEFWEDVWVACAEHNVGAYSISCAS